VHFRVAGADSAEQGDVLHIFEIIRLNQTSVRWS